MLLYDNLVVYDGNHVLLLNLISGRRKRFSGDYFPIIKEISDKKSAGRPIRDSEKLFIERLFDEKQILKESTVEEFDKRVRAQKPAINVNLGRIALEISQLCNYHCDYCLQRSITKHHSELNEEKIDHISEYLKWYAKECSTSSELEDLVITGGEPVLPKYTDIIAKIVNSIPSKNYELFTNGTQVVTLWDKLPMSKINTIQISLDGIKDVHIKTTGLSDLDLASKLYDNTIQAIFKALENNINVRIACVVNKYSLYQLPEFCSFLDKSGLFSNERFSINFSVVDDYKSKDGLDVDFNTAQQVISMAAFIKSELPYMLANFNWSDSLSAIFRYINRDENVKVNVNYSKCNFSNGIGGYFSANGNVYFCSCSNTDFGIIGTYYPEFSINKSFLNDVSRSNIFDMDKCSRCIYRYVCGGGCILHKTPHSSVLDPYCGMFLNDEVMNNIDKFVII